MHLLVLKKTAAGMGQKRDSNLFMDQNESGQGSFLMPHQSQDIFFLFFLPVKESHLTMS